jgi:hypothetical protein
MVRFPSWSDSTIKPFLLLATTSYSPDLPGTDIISLNSINIKFDCKGINEIENYILMGSFLVNPG